MKIVAQSTIPANTPYLHVGYTAASNLNLFQSAPPTAWIFVIGMLLLFIGMIIAAGRPIRRKRKGFRAWFLRWRRPFAWALAGTALVTAAFVLGFS